MKYFKNTFPKIIPNKAFNNIIGISDNGNIVFASYFYFLKTKIKINGAYKLNFINKKCNKVYSGFYFKTKIEYFKHCLCEGYMGNKRYEGINSLKDMLDYLLSDSFDEGYHEGREDS